MVEMEEKCRACLSTDSLFNWNEIIAEEVTYADLFFHITGLRKSKLKHIEWLCNDCGFQMQELYKFIETATDSERILRRELLTRKIKESNLIDNLSIEIAQLTDEDFKIEQEFQEVVKVDTDTEYAQEEFQTEDENSVDNCEPDNGSESETEHISVESEDIKFEILDLNSEDKQSDEDYDPKESKKDSVRKKSSQKCKKATNLSKEITYDCELCEKKYKTAASLKRHMGVHTMEKFLCDACPRTFTDSSSLAKHKKTHDENRKRNFTCQRCGSKFLTIHTLKGHLQIHDNKREKRFQCDQCDKAFFQKGALNVHRRIHTGDMVQCEVCDKRYPREIDLELHMRSHTGEQPFKCTTCGKAFKYNSTLYNHIRKAHFGYFKCSYCSKQYKDKQSLLEHKRLHKHSSYKCALCDREMAKKYQIKCHIKAVHSIVNIEEVEELIISSREENRHRTQRKFTDVEYKDHIKLPMSSCTNSRILASRRKY